MPAKLPLSFEGVHRFLKTLFAGDLHAKRVLSLAGLPLGDRVSLACCRHDWPRLGLGPRTPDVKQVARLLSNPGIDVDALLVHWVSYMVGVRSVVCVQAKVMKQTLVPGREHHWGTRPRAL